MQFSFFFFFDLQNLNQVSIMVSRVRKTPDNSVNFSFSGISKVFGSGVKKRTSD